MTKTESIQLDPMVKEWLDKIAPDVIEFYEKAGAPIRKPTYTMIVSFLVTRYNKVKKKC